MQRYSKQFRNAILQKMIGPEKRSAPDLAAEYGVSAATIYGWKSKLKDGTLNLMADDVSSKDRSPSEKFALVLEARRIPEEEYGEWLRRNGLHSEHITLWEQELRSTLDNESGAHDQQLKDVRKELKQKDKELQRKEKAIAEMATIIALQKKNCTSFSGSRGRMTHPEIKKQVVSDISEAVSQGAALHKCCDAIGLHPRTYRRWCRTTEDKRKGAKRTNKRALSADEKDQIVEVCCSKRFQDKNPYEIVAILLEEGIYIASPRTYYRVLKERGLLIHRGNSRAPRKPYTPPELKATGPDQVYAWDITWIPSMVNGLFWYVYSVEDIWTREIVGWTIHNEESADHAIALFNSIKTRRNLKGTWIHSDNGNPMRGATLAVMLANLGMFLSHSRPLVKNDNAYIESFFKTLKYHAAYPRRFNSMEDARRWMADFIDWYNTEHRHSGIGYVTPQQRRQGKVEGLFRKRNATLLEAFQRTPERFPKAGPTLWREKKTVYLNPSDETRKLLCKRAA